MKQSLIILFLFSNYLFAKAQVSYSNIDRNVNFEAFTSPIGTDSLELSIYIKFKTDALVPTGNLILNFSEEKGEIAIIFRNTSFVINHGSDYYEEVPSKTLKFYKLAFPKNEKPITYSFWYSYISMNSPDYSILQKEFKNVPNNMKTPSMKNKKLVTIPNSVESLIVSTIYGSFRGR